MALVIAVGPIGAIRAQEQGAPALSSGWQPLFDGHGLAGWEHIGPGEFVVDNGVLETKGGMGLLWYSREKLGDCVIRVVYKTAGRNDNSGVYIRIADKPADPWFAVHQGFEVQIDDRGPEGRSTGSIYTFSPAHAKPAKTGDWNTLEITLRGQKVSTNINGVPVTEFDASGLKADAPEKTGEGDPSRRPRPTTGYIGLQNHDAGSKVFFKEVSVRKLGGASAREAR
jgi:hypothetical protein